MKQLLLFFTILLVGCTPSGKTLKVAATPLPHAEILKVIEPELKKEGIRLKIIEVDDYTIPNRLLAEKQVDANFFQHRPFLDDQVNRFGYEIEELTKVHIEPLGIYSQKVKSLNDVKDGSLIAIPSDPINEARALNLLADVGLITLHPIAKGSYATPLDIADNPKKLKLEEIDAPFLPRTLKDVTLAVIPVNFALQGHLNPAQAIASEDTNSPYANIIAIRKGDEKREEIIALKKQMNSAAVKAFIISRYEGAIQPAF